MKMSRLVLLLGHLAIFITAPAQAQTATRYFLKIDQIPGESTDESHEHEIDVISVALGVVQPQLQRFAGGGASAAKTEISPITASKFVDKSSPLLFIYCATGKRIPTATLYARRVGGVFDYFTITLSDVLISGVTQSAADGGIIETVSLSFSKITLTYIEQNPNGSPNGTVSASFDLKANKPFTPQ